MVRILPALFLSLFFAATAQAADQRLVVHGIEINDENCQPEKLAQIERKDVREAVAGACLRRGEFKPSAPREW